ncbi:hypothetical protein NLJ89_g911 [Agrocybe chaxingu]|uniref:RRM domain-containing protein n=1 Tax=Agrocybe chaxingu TaxID=84603 RepID=A0A9W8N0Y0_9AGAR|nr:hypothetical protein NLJ89_g911 [Agrocybe chaxingu]
MTAPNAVEDTTVQPENWGSQDDQAMGPAATEQPAPGASIPADERTAGQEPEHPEYRRASSAGDNETFREKQVKPNKVYIGGLPEHTRQEDLQSCFGKIGTIINIELKVGYGFVEFDSREAAEESVAKYHEGYFMGNKIRVELSHGGGRTAKYAGDPGACFNEITMAIYLAIYLQEMIFLRSVSLPGIVGMTILRLHQCETIVALRLLVTIVTMDLLAVLVLVNMMITGEDHLLWLKGTDSLLHRITEGDIHLYQMLLTVVTVPLHLLCMTAMIEGLMTDPRVTLNRLPQGLALHRECEMITTEVLVSSSDYPDYRGRPATPPRYPPDYGRVNPDSPAVRYRRRSESPPLNRAAAPPAYEPYPMNGYISGSGAPPSGPPRGARDYPPPRHNRDIIEPVGAYRRP